MVDGSLSGRRVLVPGGTGGVGEGVVRAFLEAGAAVAVPTRTAASGHALHRRLAGHHDRLTVLVHDYSTFDGAAETVAAARTALGGLDHVVASIGGLWDGRPLTEIDERDWSSAFTTLATTHMAVARAALPLLGEHGSYTVVVGRSAEVPVPSLGLVSMEQAAVLMMQRVVAVESGTARRVFALVLGRVRTRNDEGARDSLGADEVGRVAVALAASGRPSGIVPLRDGAAASAFLQASTAAAVGRPAEVVTSAVLEPLPGRAEELDALLAELQQAVRAEPGALEYSIARALDPSSGRVRVTQRFVSPDAFAAHRAHMAGIDAPARLAALVSGPLTPPELFRSRAS